MKTTFKDEFRDISNERATCNNCKWTGLVLELADKVSYINEDIEREPCCPKCKSTDVEY